MLFYIHLEQKIYRRILKNRGKLLAPLLSNIGNNKFHSVVIFATGSSANAAYTARPYLSKKLNRPVFIEDPSNALNYQLIGLSNVLCIAISQGGHSYSTINLVKKMQETGHCIYTLTSDKESPIAKISQNLLLIGMPIEEMPYVTLGYSATILFLILLGLEAAMKLQKISMAEYQQDLSEIKLICQKLPDVVKQSTQWVQNYLPVFKMAKRISFIGYGSLYGVAREGETKITETVRISAFGNEVEAYMHGPYIGIQPADQIILPEPNGKLQGRMQGLRRFLCQHLKQVRTISNQTVTAQNDLGLDIKVNELLTGLFMTIPIHLLAFYASQIKGINLNISAYPDFDKMTNSKI